MKLWVFSSKNIKNIQLGHKARKWAVAPNERARVESQKTTKSEMMTINSRGMLYCKQTKAFHVPFYTESMPVPGSIESEIWPEPWILPFQIRPLTPYWSKRLPLEKARELLHDTFQYRDLLPGMSFAFTCEEISDSDWLRIRGYFDVVGEEPPMTEEVEPNPIVRRLLRDLV
ncbi:MAG TPA: hypothetical protein VG796_28130 [Verrucomicrobiales bacterium]|jgi:hypothetical protein|nr:hypothetical protein [Verrucomicrobiales bacterium]